ncbi:MAG: DNA-binding protein [Bacteroidetes bacterium]|jgi:superfamily I DNA and/or RNA helicase|nr:DNA-binding protein [Bacteroidota bacterium]MDF2453380.1 DNA-binding protein [Bacteroidota bacterium]
MSKSIERIKRLKELLLIEREEDYAQYKEQFLRAGIEQRKKNGVTWFPIQILSDELGYADFVHLEVERTNSLDTPHQFSTGKNVTLFSNKNPDDIQEISGTIKQSGRNKMKIILHTDELPDWCYEGRLGVNIQFDDNSYIEMQKALDEVIGARNNRVAELREIIDGIAAPTFEKIDDTLVIPQLNFSQNRAVRHILASNDIAVVHGPPGTGKTTTIVQAIRLVLQTEKQVLVCAPTNTAVDLLTEKLMEQGVNVLRVGHPARVSEELQKTTIDGQIQSHANYKDIRSLRKTAEEYFKMASKFKRVFGKEDAKQRALYYTEARNCIKESRLLEDYIVDSLFDQTQVICCTPVTSTNRALAKKKFDTLFFDEASQALEAISWIPLLKCNRVILSGDHFQLPPVVKSIKAKQEGLDKTMLDRCIEHDEISSLLTHQYRMHHQIMAFSNAYFYNNKLEADATVKDSVLSRNEDIEILNIPIELIDTAGCSFDELQNPETLSMSNKGEADLLFKHLELLLQQYTNSGETNRISIGVISPYKEQIELLKEKQLEFDHSSYLVNELAVKTIDGFQGEERDVIYISLVRSNPDSEIGFLSDIRRMNVALTRAKKKLVVIMDTATIGNHPFYKAFIEYCEKNNFYKSAWEYNYET